MNAPIQKLIRRIPMNSRLDTRLLAQRNAPLHNVGLGLGDLGRRARQREQHTPRHQQVVRVLDRLGHVRRDRDLLDLGDVVERHVALDQRQHRVAAGPAERTVLVVGGRAVPAAETLGGFLGWGSGGHVHVGEGHEVGGDGGVVGLFEAGEVEGARDEVTRDGVGGGRGLDGVERAALVLGGVELVSGGWDQQGVSGV